MQVDEAEKQGKAVILMNPVLKDIPSAAGVMGVRSVCFLSCNLKSSCETSIALVHHLQVVDSSSRMLSQRLLLLQMSWVPLCAVLARALLHQFQCCRCASSSCSASSSTHFLLLLLLLFFLFFLASVVGRPIWQRATREQAPPCCTAVVHAYACAKHCARQKRV